jgi:hypothetical protein
MQSQRTFKRPLKMKSSTSFVMSGPNLSLNSDAPRRRYGPSFVAPVSLVR